MARATHDGGAVNRLRHVAYDYSALFALCLASTLAVFIGGLIQVSFGSYTMTLVQAWQAVFNPNVLFSLDAWRAFVFGAPVPEMSRASLIVYMGSI